MRLFFRLFFSVFLSFFLSALASATPFNPNHHSNQSDQVKQQLAQLENQYQGKLGVAAFDKGTQTFIGYGQNLRFAFCSTAKVMVAAAALKQSQANPDFLQKRLTYSKQTTDQAGYAPITEQHIPTGLTVEQLGQAAIAYSDNAASNLLIQALGGTESINQFARDLGDTHFRLDRLEPEINSAIPRDPRDTSTALSMLKSLHQLVFTEALEANQRKLLLDWLLANTTGDKRIRAGAPAKAVVADKTGTGSYGSSSDIGLVWLPQCEPVMLAIYFTQGVKNAKPSDQVIAKATQILLGQFAQSNACLAKALGKT